MKDGARLASLALLLFVLLPGLQSCGGGTQKSSATSALPQLARAVQPPAEALNALPPVPLGLGRPRDASIIQTLTQTGSQASMRSSGASEDGTDLVLDADTNAFTWAVWEFMPPDGDLQAATVSMDVSDPGSGWVAIANYDTLRWDFKGPYPATAGSKTFSDLASGDYTSPGGSVFLAALSFNGTAATVTQVELTVDDGIVPTFSVSGAVTSSPEAAPLAGVSISLIGSAAAPAITDENGAYSFSGIEAGSYTLAPSLEGFSFDPETLPVEVVDSDLSGLDFTAIPPFVVSGKITLNDAPLAGVTVLVPFPFDGLGLDTLTDAEGNYSFEVTGTFNDFRIIPLLSGHSFTPPVAFHSLEGDITQNFTAETYTVPGLVTFVDHMRPLVFEPVCMNCHNSAYVGSQARHNAPSHVNWDIYDGTDEFTKEFGNFRAQEGSMPPDLFHQTINLTDSQKALFQAWEDGGFLEELMME